MYIKNGVVRKENGQIFIKFNIYCLLNEKIQQTGQAHEHKINELQNTFEGIMQYVPQKDDEMENIKEKIRDMENRRTNFNIVNTRYRWRKQ